MPRPAPPIINGNHNLREVTLTIPRASERLERILRRHGLWERFASWIATA